MLLHCTEEKFKLLTIESLHRCGFAPCKATWLLTTGRSGTEWLTHVINGLEPFRASHEPFPTLFHAAREMEDGTMPSTAARYVVKAARSLMVEQSYQHGLAFVDTSPRMTPLAPALKKVFTAATFVHLVRDPRDFVRSAMARQWYKLPHPQEWWWPHKFPGQCKEPWQRLIWFWDKTHRDALALEQKWGAGVVHRARAEDLWTDVAAIERLLAFLGGSERFVEVNRPALEASMRKPRNVGHARAEWAPEWETFLQDHAGKTMRELGYE